MDLETAQWKQDGDKAKNEGNAAFRRSEVQKAIECWQEGALQFQKLCGIFEPEDLSVAYAYASRNIAKEEKEKEGQSADDSGIDKPLAARELASCHSNISLAMLKLGEHEAALENIELALKLRPDWAKAYARKADALFAMSRFEEALEACLEGQKYEGGDSSDHKQRVLMCTETVEALKEGGSGVIVKQLLSGRDLCASSTSAASGGGGVGGTSSGDKAKGPPPVLCTLAKLKRSFTYIICDAKTRDCAVVDPAWDPEAIMKYAKEWKMNPRLIILTTHMYEHAGGDCEYIEGGVPGAKELLEMMEKEGLAEEEFKVYVHAKEAKYVKDSCHIPADKIVKLDVPMGEYKEIEFSKDAHLRLLMVATPGYTRGSACVCVPAANCLFTGSTLLVGSCGNIHQPKAKGELMFHSLTAIRELPAKLISTEEDKKGADMRIYPGSYEGGPVAAYQPRDVAGGGGGGKKKKEEEEGGRVKDMPVVCDQWNTRNQLYFTTVQIESGEFGALHNVTDLDDWNKRLRKLEAHRDADDKKESSASSSAAAGGAGRRQAELGVVGGGGEDDVSAGVD